MILFLEPIFKERLWGKDNLQKEFDFDIPSDKTGEAWLISGHLNGQTRIINGPFASMYLNDFYQKYRNEYFCKDLEPSFPLLIKILDANDKLSIQVHPDDEYALENENELGKTECWFVLKAFEGANIIKGHNASSKEEFYQRLMANDLNLFKYVPIRKNDFHLINSRTVHAINQGIMIYEIQQSSDCTYRIYDYNRKNPDGSFRELHLDKALDVIDYPEQENLQVETEVNSDDYNLKHLAKNRYFEVDYLKLAGEYTTVNRTYLLATVINGEGYINDQRIRKSDSFIITSDTLSITIKGNLEMIITKRPKIS